MGKSSSGKDTVYRRLLADKQLGLHRDERLRSYQTLGLCAGAALTILFI